MKLIDADALIAKYPTHRSLVEKLTNAPGIDSSVIDEMRAEMCDDYCKFAWGFGVSKDNLADICNKCPLNRLSKYEDIKE